MITITTSAIRIVDTGTSCTSASATPPTHMMIADTATSAVVSTMLWTWPTSLTVLVISDGAPIWSTSRADRLMTLPNTFCRRSRPSPADMRELSSIAPLAVRICTAATPSMVSPVPQM